MLYNRNFGHLKEQQITYAPLNIEVDGTWYCPGSETQLIDAGWMKIIDTPYPTDGKNYSSSWEIQDNQIVKIWTEIPQPEPEPLTPPQQREEAYMTLPIIEYGNGIITVDEAEKLCVNYMFEITEEAQAKVDELKVKITAAKAQIREMYPDIIKEVEE